MEVGMIEKRRWSQRGKKTTTEGKGSEVLLFAVVDARHFLIHLCFVRAFYLDGK